MILVVVYVGAVVVLFLFVVMMLDVDFVGAAPGHAELSAGRRRHWADPARRAGFGARHLAYFAGDGARPPCPSRPLAIWNTEAHRPRSLYPIRLLLSSRRHGPAGRHGWRNRADASPQGGRKTAEHRRSGCARAGNAIECEKSGRDRASEGDSAHDRSASPTILPSRQSCSPSAFSAFSSIARMSSSF